jgi:hypothetical protein
MDKSHVSMDQSPLLDELQSQRRNIYIALGLGLIDTNTAHHLLRFLEVDVVTNEGDTALTQNKQRRIISPQP